MVLLLQCTYNTYTLYTSDSPEGRENKVGGSGGEGLNSKIPLNYARLHVKVMLNKEGCQ